MGWLGAAIGMNDFPMVRQPLVMMVVYHSFDDGMVMYHCRSPQLMFVFLVETGSSSDQSGHHGFGNGGGLG